MARCDQGYLCSICGAEVETLSESELYLKYVIGWVEPEKLHLTPERHLRCNPALAQFIEDPEFDPMVSEGPSDKRFLDPVFVAKRTELISRGFRRLKELQRARPQPPVTEYPLPEALAKFQEPVGTTTGQGELIRQAVPSPGTPGEG